MDLRDLTTHFEENDFLFEEGDAGDCAYIIESGSVELSIDKGGRILVIATLGEGDVLGEMALIDKCPRTATARAMEETNTIAIPLDYIEQKIDTADPTVRLFLRLVMERYRDIHARLSHVLESMSPSRDKTSKDKINSASGEIENIMTQYMDMQKRINSALSLSTFKATKSSLGEETIKSTRKLVTEEKILKAALENEEFCVHYQPIVELDSGKTVGCEALVRWNHPSGKLILPSSFIKKAEVSGLIIDLGYWIAERACQFQSRLSREFEQPLFVTINLSLLLDNPEIAGKTLHRLKETKAKLAIDDFGTGYSSFSYLHQFPFDTMKIDRSFIGTMLQDNKSNEITKSLVNLSHDLGMNVVAEGIGSGPEVELLRGYQAEFGQGFYYSKAVAEDAFIKLL